MSVFEGLFEKFEKGDLRVAEKEASGMTADSDGTLVVTVEDLVSVEEVVAVKINNANSGNYQTIDEDSIGSNGDVIAGSGVAEGGDISEDNEVDITFYEENDAGATQTANDASLPDFKVVARGY